MCDYYESASLLSFRGANRVPNKPAFGLSGGRSDKESLPAKVCFLTAIAVLAERERLSPHFRKEIPAKAPPDFKPQVGLSAWQRGFPELPAIHCESLAGSPRNYHSG